MISVASKSLARPSTGWVEGVNAPPFHGIMAPAKFANRTIRPQIGLSADGTWNVERLSRLCRSSSFHTLVMQLTKSICVMLYFTAINRTLPWFQLTGSVKAKMTLSAERLKIAGIIVLPVFVFMVNMKKFFCPAPFAMVFAKWSRLSLKLGAQEFVFARNFASKNDCHIASYISLTLERQYGN